MAGMAAAVIAQLSDIEKCCIRDKRIEVSLNGDFKDIALVDAVISDDLWVGSKAIWEPEKIAPYFCYPLSSGKYRFFLCRGLSLCRKRYR